MALGKLGPAPFRAGRRIDASTADCCRIVTTWLGAVMLALVTTAAPRTFG
jgi:hypothetical protein